MKKTTLLVDGDILAYRASAAAEKKSVKVIHKSGQHKVFKNRTEFKKFLESREQKERIVEYTFEDVVEPESVELALNTIKGMLSKLDSITFADKREVYISGKDNFRTNLLLPTKYKAGRDDTVRPVHLDAAKEYLLDHQSAIRAVKIEADDILSVRAYEEIEKGNIAIIASNDKDTYQAEGVFMFDFTKENPVLFEIPTVGELRKVKTQVKGEGLKFLAFQLLAGDTADDYCPYYLAKKNSGVVYGAASAYKDIADLDFQDEILNKVIERYKSWYPEPFDYIAWNGTEVKSATWESMLDLYFKCAWMKRAWTDPSNWRMEFARRGVDLSCLTERNQNEPN